MEGGEWRVECREWISMYAIPRHNRLHAEEEMLPGEGLGKGWYRLR